MKALCWCGSHDVRVQTVPDPKILNPRDAIVKVTSTAICGSDLHLLDGYVPTMKAGDIMGHEFMGEVVEVGAAVNNLRRGDRVVVPFPIACGSCFFCKRDLWSLCENSNPNAWMAEKLWGHSPCGIFGYSHLTGGYAGGQAEYVRVPFADIGPIRIDNGALRELTGGRGPDACIDAVGLEAHSHGLMNYYDKAKSAMRLETDRPIALREAILACRNGGTVSVPGVYGGIVDKFPLGAIMNRSLTIKTGQTHVHRYLRPLLERVESGDLHPERIVTHTLPLDDAPRGYALFRDKQEECVKVVLKP